MFATAESALVSRVRSATSDSLERLLIEAEVGVARLRHMETVVIRELDQRQIATADGCRTMAQWVSSRADVNADTARALVRVANADHPELNAGLEDGNVSFDRASELARLDDPSDLRPELDIAGLRRTAGLETELSCDDDYKAFEARRLVAQPDLHGLSWKLSGLVPALEGARIFSTLDEIADTLPAAPDGARESRAARRVDALSVVCDRRPSGGARPAAGQLRRSGTNPSSGTPDVIATVIVDARTAAPSRGQRGAWLVGGPRVGPATLARVLCEGVTEVTAMTSDGTPLAVGTAQTAIPPRTRRAVLARDLGVCSADGCDSSYRLQPHHINERAAQDGDNDVTNLASLCWYHHHVVIHGRGFTIDPHSPPGRRRFIRPTRQRAGPL